MRLYRLERVRIFFLAPAGGGFFTIVKMSFRPRKIDPPVSFPGRVFLLTVVANRERPSPRTMFRRSNRGENYSGAPFLFFVRIKREFGRRPLLVHRMASAERRRVVRIAVYGIEAHAVVQRQIIPSRRFPFSETRRFEQYARVRGRIVPFPSHMERDGRVRLAP